MKLLPLSGKNGQGKFAKVDDWNYDWLSRYKWCQHKGRNGVCYAVRRTTRQEGNRVVSMHREIMRANKGEYVDHKDGDGLSNEEANLRRCTNKENVTNARIRSDNTSGYKNVSLHRDGRRWKVQAAFNNQIVYIGLFDNIHHAALAADLWAVDLHGDFARTNFKVLKWG